MTSKLGHKIVVFCVKAASLILLPVFWIVGKIYDVFLRPGDLRRTREKNEEFGREVQRSLQFLFTEYGGVLLASGPVKEPSPFDYAVARVVLPEFRLRFIRERGAFDVGIAPNHAPDETLDLSKLLSIIDKRFEQTRFKSFADIQAVLEPRMRLLQHALGPDRYPEWRPFLPFASGEREIKQRLYGDR